MSAAASTSGKVAGMTTPTFTRSGPLRSFETFASEMYCADGPSIYVAGGGRRIAVSVVERHALARFEILPDVARALAAELIAAADAVDAHNALERANEPAQEAV